MKATSSGVPPAPERRKRNESKLSVNSGSTSPTIKSWSWGKVERSMVSVKAVMKVLGSEPPAGYAAPTAARPSMVLVPPTSKLECTFGLPANASSTLAVSGCVVTKAKA